MKIQLDRADKLRIINGSYDSMEDPFISVYAVESSSDHHVTRGLSIAAFEMHQIFLIKKERIYRLFSFERGCKVYLSDFGFWSDGEIIFTNSEIVDND